MLYTEIIIQDRLHSGPFERSKYLKIQTTPFYFYELVNFSINGSSLQKYRLPEKHIEKISHFKARECISDLISEFECELSHWIERQKKRESNIIVDETLLALIQTGQNVHQPSLKGSIYSCECLQFSHISATTSEIPHQNT